MIHKDMLIEEIIETYPNLIKPLQEMGVQCIVCGEPVWGTLEENIISKKLTNPDEIISRLNQVIRDEQSEVF
jgi:methionine synthase II (cobalamin-independent)